MKVSSFPAIETSSARILVLGSMPGVESLRQQQYYAHPRNAFWYICGELFDAGPNRDYAERIQILKQCDIAVWDVLKHCQREGSLDSNIRHEQPNDLAGFVSQHAQLATICFNGKKAEQVFQRYVLKQNPGVFENIQLHALPSTSPAMASLTREQKLAQWRKVLVGTV